MENHTCNKVKFATEAFALYYLEKLKATSCRTKTPKSVYLCPKCLTWHLTSCDTPEEFINKKSKEKIESLTNDVFIMSRTINSMKTKLVEYKKTISKLEHKLKEKPKEEQGCAISLNQCNIQLPLCTYDKKCVHKSVKNKITFKL